MFPHASLSSLVAMAFQAYYLILLARVLLSWFPGAARNSFFLAIGPTIYNLTEPLLRPMRNWLRPYQGGMPIDFSPMLLIMLLSLAQVVVQRALLALGL